MPLDPEFLPIADRFLAFIEREAGAKCIVCDERGVIARASVRSRVGAEHAGAKRILRGECDEYQVTAEMEAANPLTREGYNCPIVVDGRRIGTFGVAGRLEVTRPVGRVAAMVLSGWVNELRQRQALRAVAAQVFASVDRLAARADAARGEAAAGARESADAGRAAQERLEQAADVARLVQDIAMQSRILSINGSVEATRAGDGGRSFGVVAKDMTRLADETKSASGEIERALREVGDAVRSLNDAVARSARSAAEQGQALAEATGTVAELRAALERLGAGAGAASSTPGVRAAR